MITAVVIDDEPNARALITLLIEKHCPNVVTIIGEAGTIEEGYNLIVDKEPQLIFLDIQLGHFTGFDLLQKFNKPNFSVIFITAYAEYAIQAIKFCAVDYILKPLFYEPLVEAIYKVKETIYTAQSNNKLHSLMDMLTNPNEKSNKIAIANDKGYTMVAVGQIMYLEAQDNYTTLYLADGTKILSTTNLAEYDDRLKPYSFMRIHQSYTVNKDYILHYIKGDGGQIELTNKIILPISKRRKPQFLSWLQL